MVVTPDLNIIFFIRKNIVYQFGYFRKKPSPCAQFVSFRKNDGQFYPIFSIIGAFLKAQMTNFIQPAVTVLFWRKNPYKYINGGKFKKNLGIQQKWQLRLTSITSLSLERTLCINSGIFKKRPPPSHCGQFVYFIGNNGHFYPMFSIIGAFLKAQVTNFIHPTVTPLFDKKTLQNINGTKFQ